MATELAAGATLAMGAAKRLLNTSLSESLETAMEDESQAISAIAKTQDARDGIAAFLSKSEPTFQRR
jgi:2-(1,2-epoxy-1,2-dihydrophenyl)acetyl-CoA isomerase